MKDGIKFIKDAYYTLLTNAVTYNGTTIPVYEDTADESDNDFYIVVSTVTNADFPTKSKFFNETTVLIDVVTQLNFRITKIKEISDIITGKVLNLVIPSVGSTGLSDNDDFQILDVRKTSSEHIPTFTTDSKYIVRRLTRFSQLVIEK